MTKTFYTQMEPNGADKYPKCKTNHAHWTKKCSDCGLIIGSDAADDEHVHVVEVKTVYQLTHKLAAEDN